MANSGGGGTKFVSVNLNKSYGQPSNHNPPPYSGSYGQAAANRSRPGSGGGGMVVLSRSRGLQKAQPKLSVPPPLNLPSLRKEHERFDLSGSGGGPSGTVGPGGGPRPHSSGMGWTKPTAVASQEKDENGDAQAADGVDQSVHAIEGGHRVNGAYMPPSARFGGVGLVIQDLRVSQPEKLTVLRGEDFPSLQAALPVSSGPSQKQKDTSNQKQKSVVGDELNNGLRDTYHLSSHVDMRPQVLSSSYSGGNGSVDNGGDGRGVIVSHTADHSRKQDDVFPGPLPLVRFNPRSDWADDERDTSHGFAERGRDHGFTKSETYWDRDFDIPRASVLPHKQANQYERWGRQDDEAGKMASEVLRSEPYHRDMPSREGRDGSIWRASTFPKDRLNSQEFPIERSSTISRITGLNKDMSKENMYVPPDASRDGTVTGSRNPNFGRRDMAIVPEGRPNLIHTAESYSSRASERIMRDNYGNEQSSRYRNTSASKPAFASGGKTSPLTAPVLTVSREKRVFPKTERSYLDDSFTKEFGSAGFDDRDPFAGGLVGVLKRKKDVKQTDFHDPVRESFEAELERVQKIQELERQRIIEEQERALELARREEEERQRLIREEEERVRKLEEEAREAAWRAEQERLEAIRRAEEQKVAREEEKKRIFMEEERRKQAAKQKLLELEARMAKRQAEAAKDNASIPIAIGEEKTSALIKEKETLREVDLDNWEDGDKMVERITSSASFDSAVLSRPFEMSSRSYPSRESSNFPDRGKPVNSWRRDVFENGSSLPSLSQDQDIGHHSSRRDASAGGRMGPRKEFYGAPGYMQTRTYFKGVQEPFDDDSHQKEQRWILAGDADLENKNREMETEFHDNIGDIGWNQGRSRGHTRFSHSERLYPSTEADDPYSYGRSRYSLRQPRVLPPPSVASMQRTSLNGVNERPGPSHFMDNDNQNNHTIKSESTRLTAHYHSHQEGIEPAELVNVQREANNEDLKMNKDTTPRCDSQSSLSVSSPPNSPPHLSHDELDESGDSPITAEAKVLPHSGNESTALNDNTGKDTMVTRSSSISAVEDEEWTIENNELQQQEEYDEDEDGYEEEDEVREVDDENLDLNQEFEGLHLEDKESSHIMDSLVLGFDQGVEVGLPRDDFDRNLGNKERSFHIAEGFVHIAEEQKTVDGMHTDGQSHQLVEGSFQASLNGSSGRIQENDKVMQHSVTQAHNALYTTTDLLKGIDASSSGSGLSAQQTLLSSVDVSTSAQTIASSMPSTRSQSDLPVKLQFGLFSGPSLIPSPVPAIQIGSIQMPLHLHPPVGSPLTHIHPSQPPIFQFGQLRYTTPISQGILPMAPQSMALVQQNVQAHYNLNQTASGSLPIQSTQDISRGMVKEDAPSFSVNKQPVFVSGSPDQTDDNVSRGLGPGLVSRSVENDAHVHVINSKVSSDIIPEPGIRAENKVQHDAVFKNKLQTSKERKIDSESQVVQSSIHSVSADRNAGGLKIQGPVPGNKGKRFTYAVRSSNVGSAFPASDISRSEFSGFPRRPRRTVHRTEFRIRENVDKRQSSSTTPLSDSGPDDKSNHNARAAAVFRRSGSKRGTMSSKPLKETVESEKFFSSRITQEVDPGNKMGKELGKSGSSKNKRVSIPGEGHLKRSISEEDVDAPLQSGVVRVFKQAGIEAPSDEDDFIEVRSKRQMLNDRREQREKEIKAKSRVIKPPRRPRTTKQATMLSSSANKVVAPVSGEASDKRGSSLVSSDGQGVASNDLSTGLTSVMPQPLAPIGTPALSSSANTSASNSGVQADIRSNKSVQSGSVSLVSGGGNNLGSGLMFETKNKVADIVTSSSFSSWAPAGISQQVMALTQTQLEEAMKPAHFDVHVASVGLVSDPILPSSSILTKDKSFSSAASPINSLLAGEKIQFGAVTSPTVLPPSSRSASHVIGAPGSNRSEMQISLNLSSDENDCTLFFEKEKPASDSSVHLQDCEAEAEAAASAVAVAAISSDEIVGNGLGSVTVSETKSFGGADIDGITAVITGDQQLGRQSRGEESLSVSLPADLSVETPISLWPPLPSPPNSSAQMLSHFPGGPPSHFPFYEMNPMLGGPIFAFGPREESAGIQSQSQKSSAPSSGPLGTWQQCHTTVDSFYGPPAGFTGPFISPPGSIHGVQGPPHMVVYNHFAPVGQFGQVGLSFMGTTYIPSGKQPDWKHDPSSSAMGIGEGDMNHMNVAPAQRNSPNVPAPVQQLSPGSSLLPIASPLPMFDVSPFQSTPDITVQARWSHLSASPLHSIPLSRPLQQQQAEGGLPSQFGQGHPVDQTMNVNRFSESRSSTPSDSGPGFPVAADANITGLPEELGLVDSSHSHTSGTSNGNANQSSASGNANSDSGMIENPQNGSKGQSTSVFKMQQKNASAQQSHSAGYNYQRGGGLSQRNTAGNEWSHRRMGFHGRNQSLGAEKGFPPSKMKQIYVAKQTNTGSKTAG